MINIILLEPRIPQNTGNIGRLALATNAKLHLIHPLGFVLDDKAVRRSGMDYFKSVDLLEWDSLDAFLNVNPINKWHFFLTTKAKQCYFDANFSGVSLDSSSLDSDCYLWFGREDAGLPKELLESNAKQCFRIPMFNDARSLNLSNAVSIVVYEVIRQNL